MSDDKENLVEDPEEESEGSEELWNVTQPKSDAGTTSDETSTLRASTEYQRGKIYSDDENAPTCNGHIEDSEAKEVPFHDMLRDHVGEFSTHQAGVMFLVGMKNVLALCHTLAPVFMAATPEHWCDVTNLTQYNCSRNYLEDVLLPKEKRLGEMVPSQCKYYKIDEKLADEVTNKTLADKECPVLSHLNQTKKCHKWTYDTQYYTSTIVNEWNLVCSDAYLVSNANSFYWIGHIIGLIFGGHIADRLGRKPTGTLGYVMMLIFSTLTAFSPNYLAFLIFRLINSGALTLIGIGTGIAALEVVGDAWRVTFFVIEGTAWILGYGVLVTLAYYERRWRYLQMYITLPYIFLFLLYLWFLTESPRWLLTQDRQADAMKYLRLIARRNKRSIPPNLTATVTKEETAVNLTHIFRWPAMRTVTLILFYLWFVMGFTYYGISMHTGDFGGNPYVTFILSASVDLPSYLLAMWLFKRFGRVLPFAYGFIIGGIILIVSIFVPTNLNWVVITSAMVGKFLVNVPGSATWLYTLELYPTSIRSIGTHMCSVVARIGAICASYIGILAKMNPAYPLLVFGITSFLGGAICLILPETKGHPLKQTIEDGEEFMKQNLYKSAPCHKCCLRRRFMQYKNIPLSPSANLGDENEDLIPSSDEEF